MLIYIVLIAPQILYKADLMVQASVAADDLVGKLIHALCFLLLCDGIENLTNREDRHCLKAFKFDVVR